MAKIGFILAFTFFLSACSTASPRTNSTYSSSGNVVYDARYDPYYYDSYGAGYYGYDPFLRSYHPRRTSTYKSRSSRNRNNVKRYKQRTNRVNRVKHNNRVKNQNRVRSNIKARVKNHYRVRSNTKARVRTQRHRARAVPVRQRSSSNRSRARRR